MKTVHDVIVSKLEARKPDNVIGGRRGFMKSLIDFAAQYHAAYEHDPEPMTLTEARKYVREELAKVPTVIPDYFEIRPEENLILLYEVEDTHKLGMDKLVTLYDLCGNIEDGILGDFLFFVICLDRYGNEVTRLGFYELEVYYIEAVIKYYGEAAH